MRGRRCGEFPRGRMRKGAQNTNVAKQSRPATVNIVLALTREKVTHSFPAGRIDAAFIASIVTVIKMPLRQVLVCGSNPFVEAIAEGAIAAGVKAVLIKTERIHLAAKSISDNIEIRRQGCRNIVMVPRGGIEPPTLRFSIACSTN